MKKQEIENILKSDLREIIQISFQPIISLRKGEIIGYKIFSKFVGENFNDMSVEEVIKMLEDIDLIHTLDFVILEKIRKYLIEENLTLCVNISPKSIAKIDFLEKIEDLKDGVNNLQIEITERGRVNYTDLVYKIIKLKKMGVKIIMDDFPVGSSSLENLLKTHIDGVKIDRDFIKYLQSPKGKRIYKSVVGLLKEIGNEITAEGIESESDLNFVKDIGVDLAQGYFIGKPISEDEILKILNSKKEDV